MINVENYECRPRTPCCKNAGSTSGWWRAAVTAIALLVSVGYFQTTEADEEKPITVSRITVRLVREANIPAEDSGTIEQIHTAEGRSVKKGDVVAVLDNRRQILDVNAAQLNLKVATLRAEDKTAVRTSMAQLAEAKSGRRVKEIALQISEAEAKTDVRVQIASAETKLRQLELDRAEGARKSFKGSISESQIDRLKTSVAKGQLEIQQAKDDHAVQKMKPEADQAAIQQKDDEIRRFEALLAQGEKELVVAGLSRDIRANEAEAAEWNLERRNVRAPFDGVIVEINSEEGEWIEQGTVVARLISLAKLSADGFLPVDQASLKLVGRPVSIDIRVGGRTRSLKGTVTFVSPEVDPVNQKVRFRAEFENPETVILPGMNGSLVIE